MKRRIFNIPWVSVISLIFTVAISNIGVGTAFAHGDAVLTITPVAAAPGDTITVSAEGVETDEIFTIRLQGLGFDAELGEVTVGADEDFHQEFIVPTDTPPGSYQVQATSEEGEVLTAEFTVLENRSTPALAETAAEPSASPMVLKRTRSIGQLTVLLAGILISAGLGYSLVRRR